MSDRRRFDLVVYGVSPQGPQRCVAMPRWSTPTQTCADHTPGLSLCVAVRKRATEL